MPTRPKGSDASSRQEFFSPPGSASAVNNRQLVAVAFQSRAEINQAIGLFFDEPALNNVRYRSVGRKTLFVPEGALPVLAKHLDQLGTSFSVSNVSQISSSTSSTDLGLVRKSGHPGHAI